LARPVQARHQPVSRFRRGTEKDLQLQRRDLAAAQSRLHSGGNGWLFVFMSRCAGLVE